MMLAALKDTTRLALDDRGLRGDVLEFKARLFLEKENLPQILTFDLVRLEAVCSFLKKAFFVEEALPLSLFRRAEALDTQRS